MSYEHLLSPITIKNVELRNRMVVPSMGTNLGNDDGSVSQRLIDYYRTRAAARWMSRWWWPTCWRRPASTCWTSPS